MLKLMLEVPVPVETPEARVKVPPFWLVPDPALPCRVVTALVPLLPVAVSVRAVRAGLSVVPVLPAG